MFDMLILVIVGVLWGVTNYLIELYYFEYQFIEKETFFTNLKNYLLINYKPLLFFLLNQLGSCLFYFSLIKQSKRK